MKIDFASLGNPEYVINLILPMAIHLVSALAIFFIGRWITQVLVSIAQRGMLRARQDQTLVDFLGTVLHITLMVFVVIAALGQLGVKTTAAAAIVGGSALAVGLSLQKQLASLAAGVMLVIFRPFRKGEFVDIAGVMGTVERIQIVNTVLVTTNNQVVTIPNAQVWDSPIVNYSARNTRRVDMRIRVGYDADLQRVRAALERVIANESRVLSQPPPTIAVGELTDTAVIVLFRPWLKTAEYWPALWAMTEAIKQQLADEGIRIAAPQMDIRLSHDDPSTPLRPAA